MSGAAKKVTKSVKKVTKSVTKVAKSAYKATLGGSMDILGLTAREEQQKQAERMARQQEAQAKQQQANTIEQARGATMQMESDMERQRILAEQEQQRNATPNDTATPSTEIAPVATDAATKRKKFQTPQVGGTGGGGTSIRL